MKLLQTDGNAELLETIIMLLLSVVDDCPASELESHIMKESINTKNNDEECQSQIMIPKCIESMNVIEHHSKASIVLQWLTSFTTLDRFGLMIRFFSKDLVSSIVAKFQESTDPQNHLIALKYSS